ncbi:MAG: phenylpyruvate tautomerase MIF-related protein [Gammaproteobacteria bacterium]
MPCLRIQTNAEPDPSALPGLLAALSQAVAAALGKDERYVMVALDAGTPMLFAGSDAPLAYLELKSIGLPARTEALSRTLCRAVGEGLGIPADRIYIEFADAPPHLWGWNGGTFG